MCDFAGKLGAGFAMTSPLAANLDESVLITEVSRHVEDAAVGGESYGASLHLPPWSRLGMAHRFTAEWASESTDFFQKPGLHVVYEAAHFVAYRHKRVCLDAAHGLTHFFFKVRKCFESKGRSQPRFRLDACF